MNETIERIKDRLLSYNVLTYTNLIFNSLQKCDVVATGVWSISNGYTRFKSIESAKCLSWSNQHTKDLYTANNNRFKKILWTRDVMLGASLLGTATYFAAGSPLPVILGAYILILLSFALAIRIYMNCSNRSSIKDIRHFPSMAKKVYNDEGKGGLYISATKNAELMKKYPLGSPIPNYDKQ